MYQESGPELNQSQGLEVDDNINKQVEQVTDQEKKDIELLESLRARIIDSMRQVATPKDLFMSVVKEVRSSKNAELSPEVKNEIRNILKTSLSSLSILTGRVSVKESESQEIEEDNKLFQVANKLQNTRRSISSKDDSDISKTAIGDIKELAASSDMLRDGIEDEMRNRVEVIRVDLSELKPDLAELGIELPEDEGVGYKGGAARVALKKYIEKHSEELEKEYGLKFPKRLLDAELPLSDKDMVATSDVKNIWDIAQKLGVDADGVEKLNSLTSEQDLKDYFINRDIDANQCLLTKDELIFSKDALMSALSGTIHPSAARMESLFGVDRFYYNDKPYFTNKILYRLVKNTADAKSDRFEIPDYNKEVSLGIYWLVLIRKAYSKETGPERVARIYSIAKQMDQTKTNSPEEFVQELFNKYPFFRFSGEQSDLDVAKWVLTKYLDVAKRHIKREHQLYPGDIDGLTSNNSEPLIVEPDTSNLTDEKKQKAIDYLKDLAAKEQEKTLSASA